MHLSVWVASAPRLHHRLISKVDRYGHGLLCSTPTPKDAWQPLQAGREANKHARERDKADDTPEFRKLLITSEIAQCGIGLVRTTAPQSMRSSL